MAPRVRVADFAAKLEDTLALKSGEGHNIAAEHTFYSLAAAGHWPREAGFVGYQLPAAALDHEPAAGRTDGIGKIQPLIGRTRTTGLENRVDEVENLVEIVRSRSPDFKPRILRRAANRGA